MKDPLAQEENGDEAQQQTTLFQKCRIKDQSSQLSEAPRSFILGEPSYPHFRENLEKEFQIQHKQKKLTRKKETNFQNQKESRTANQKIENTESNPRISGNTQKPNKNTAKANQESKSSAYESHFSGGFGGFEEFGATASQPPIVRKETEEGEIKNPVLDRSSRSSQKNGLHGSKQTDDDSDFAVKISTFTISKIKTGNNIFYLTKIFILLTQIF